MVQPPAKDIGTVSENRTMIQEFSMAGFKSKLRLLFAVCWAGQCFSNIICKTMKTIGIVSA